MWGTSIVDVNYEQSEDFGPRLWVQLICECGVHVKIQIYGTTWFFLTFKHLVRAYVRRRSTELARMTKWNLKGLFRWHDINARMKFILILLRFWRKTGVRGKCKLTVVTTQKIYLTSKSLLPIIQWTHKSEKRFGIWLALLPHRGHSLDEI